MSGIPCLLDDTLAFKRCKVQEVVKPMNENEYTPIPGVFGFPVDLSQIQLDTPPGLLGLMCEELNHTESRNTVEFYPVAALQTISMVSRRCTLNGEKFKANLSAICVAPSAAGKQNTHSSVRSWVEASGLVANPLPRSEASIMEFTVKQDGYALYSVDECQSFFRSALSSKTSEHHTNTASTMMTMATDNRLVISPTHQKVWEEQCRKDVERYELAATLYTADKDPELNAAITRKLMWSKAGERHCIKGVVEQPHLCFFGHTTFEHTKDLQNPRYLNDGFLGRVDLALCYSRRPKLKLVANAPDPFRNTSIVKHLRAIEQGLNVVTSPEAKELLEQVNTWLETSGVTETDHAYGAVYARASERIMKYSFLAALACNSVAPVLDLHCAYYGIVYAFARMNDLVLFTGATNEAGNPQEERFKQVTSWLVSRLERDGEVTKSAMNQNFKNNEWFKRLVNLHEQDKGDLFTNIHMKMEEGKVKSTNNKEVIECEMVRTGRSYKMVLKK